MSEDDRGLAGGDWNLLQQNHLPAARERSAVARLHQPSQLDRQLSADVGRSPNGFVGEIASGTVPLVFTAVDVPAVPETWPQERVGAATYGTPQAHGTNPVLLGLREQDAEFSDLIAAIRVESSGSVFSPRPSTRGEIAAAEFSTPSVEEAPTQTVAHQLQAMQIETPRSQGVSRRRIWVLDDAVTAEHSGRSGVAATSTPAPRNPLPSRGALTCSTNKTTPGPSCAICLSPVKNRCDSGGCNDPHGEKFKTPCCNQLFHRDCLAKFKARAMYHEPAACPLCRSQQPSGLTPKPVPTGFVTSSSVHAAMLARVARARNAVQRSLQEGGRPAEQPSPGLDAAFRDALSARDEARTEAGA